MSASDNMSGKQFSQRSFADVEPSFAIKPTAEHRWPRGYTPERYHETAAVLDDPDNFHSHDTHPRELQARVIDTVARSNMDPSTLDYSSSPLESGGELTHMAPKFVQMHSPRSHGAFESDVGYGPDKHDINAHSTIHLDTPPGTPGQDYTLLHELGHHASMLARNEHSPAEMQVQGWNPQTGRSDVGNTHTAKILGLEEGAADRFAEENVVYHRGETFRRDRYTGMSYGFSGKKGETFNRNYGQAHWEKPLSTGVTPAQQNRDTEWDATNHMYGDRGWQNALDDEPNAAGEKTRVFMDKPRTRLDTNAEHREKGRQIVQNLNQMGYRGHHTLRPNR